MHHVVIERMNIVQPLYEQFEEDDQDRMLDTAGEHDLFQCLGNNNNPQNVKNLKLHCNFDQISDEFTNSIMSNKVRICCTSRTMTLKHAQCFHSQNRMFHIKFTKETMMYHQSPQH